MPPPLSIRNTQLLPYQSPAPYARPSQQFQLAALPQYARTTTLPYHTVTTNTVPLPLARHSNITGWYTDTNSTSPDDALAPARSAHETALTYIKSELTTSEQNRIFLSSSTSVRDVQVAVLDAHRAYETKANRNKLQKWLRKLSARVLYYGGILDVLSQHHPEYVSLAWGTMKFIFVAVLNHEEILLQTAKTLTKIADVLPRAELSSILYPTAAMASAVASLYAQILRFLMQALKLYKRGRFSRAVSAVASPFAIASKEIVEEIEEASRRVDALASSAARAELRDLHILIQEMSFNFQTHTTQIHLTLNQQAEQFSHFQLSQLTEVLSITYDPEASFTYCQSLFTRRNRRAGLGESQNRRIQARLEGWAEGNDSSLLVVQGVTRAIADAKDLAFDVLGLIRESNVPVIWALPADLDAAAEDELTTTAILKTLVLQTLQIHPGILASKSTVLTPAHFRRAVTETQWLDLLCTVLAGIPRIFIVVDAERLFQASVTAHEDMSWPQQFVRLFQRLVERNLRHVKILVVGYNMSLEMRESLEREGICQVVCLKRARLPKKLRRKAQRQGRMERKVTHGLRSDVFTGSFEGGEDGDEVSSEDG